MITHRGETPTPNPSPKMREGHFAPTPNPSPKMREGLYSVNLGFLSSPSLILGEGAGGWGLR